jgi:ketosteroid isomerase-like protein
VAESGHVAWLSSLLVVDDADLLAANGRFYAAFEARSIDAMDEVWDHGPDVVCTHPGWRTLLGWATVRSSWEALLANDEHLQFIVTGEHPVVRGSMGFVCAFENILSSAGPSGSIAVLNVFARGDDGEWRMVAHHGSPVMR